MAGSSTNWFKVGRGSAKGRMFVSNAQLAYNLGASSMEMKAQLASELASDDPEQRQAAIEGMIRLADLSTQPRGQAKSALKPIAPPIGWAQSPSAQAMIAYQEAALGDHSMDSNQNPANELMRKAFEEANDGMPTWTSPGLVPGAASGPRDSAGDAPGLEQLWSYTKTGFRGINASLWAGRRDSSGKIAFPLGAAYGDELVASRKIQDLLLGMVAPFDMTVTRAVGNYHELAAWVNSANPGDSYINLGFDSSSIDPNIDVYGRDVLLKMRVPAGSKGGYINSIFTKNNSSEQEWLVPANSSWVVTGKRLLPDGKTEVTVDLIDQRRFDGSVVWP